VRGAHGAVAKDVSEDAFKEACVEAHFLGVVESAAAQVVHPHGEGLLVALEQPWFEGGDAFAHEARVEESWLSWGSHGVG